MLTARLLRGVISALYGVIARLRDSVRCLLLSHQMEQAEKRNMMKRILVTGGAGFIGSHLADELLAQGYEVRILDSLSSQVHGPKASVLTILIREIELIVGDVRDEVVLRKA